MSCATLQPRACSLLTHSPANAHAPRSLDGVLDVLNSKNMTDAGPLQLIDHDDKVRGRGQGDWDGGSSPERSCAFSGGLDLHLCVP